MLSSPLQTNKTRRTGLQRCRQGWSGTGTPRLRILPGISQPHTMGWLCPTPASQCWMMAFPSLWCTRRRLTFNMKISAAGRKIISPCVLLRKGRRRGHGGRRGVLAGNPKAVEDLGCVGSKHSFPKPSCPNLGLRKSPSLLEATVPVPPCSLPSLLSPLHPRFLCSLRP